MENKKRKIFFEGKHHAIIDWTHSSFFLTHVWHYTEVFALRAIENAYIFGLEKAIRINWVCCNVATLWVINWNWLLLFQINSYEHLWLFDNGKDRTRDWNNVYVICISQWLFSTLPFERRKWLKYNTHVVQCAKFQNATDRHESKSH